MPRTLALAALSALTLVAVAPPLVAAGAAGAAAVLGCTVDEGSSHPCPLGAWDIGDGLQAAVVAGGWLSLLAAPGMAVAVLAWTWVLWRRRGRRRRSLRGGVRSRRGPWRGPPA